MGLISTLLDKLTGGMASKLARMSLGLGSMSIPGAPGPVPTPRIPPIPAPPPGPGIPPFVPRISNPYTPSYPPFISSIASPYTPPPSIPPFVPRITSPYNLPPPIPPKPPKLVPWMPPIAPAVPVDPLDKLKESKEAMERRSSKKGDIFDVLGKSFGLDVLRGKSGRSREDREEFSAASMKNLWKSGKKMMDGAGKAASSDRFGEIGGGIADTVSAAGGAVGGPVGRSIQMFAKLANVGFESIERLRQWNDKLYENNVKFSEFSASMTRVQVDSEIRQMRLSHERGERRAASADVQARQRDRLNRELAPAEDWWANSMNRTSARWSWVSSEFIRSFQNPTEIGGPWRRRGELNENQVTPSNQLGNWMAETGRDLWLEEYGRPIHFIG